jgi:Bax protein
MKLIKDNSIKLAIIAIFVASIWLIFFAKVTPPNFAEAPAGKDRKTMFFNYFLPIVAELNIEIKQDRKLVLTQCEGESVSHNSALLDLGKKYRINEGDLKNRTLCEVLTLRVDEIPASLALAQAANESAWGTARFAQQGNNFFGQWCFKKGCGIVPKGRDSGKGHEVASFRSPQDSVRSYMMNLNTHNAYISLRNIRQSLRQKGDIVTGNELSHGLNKYSERGTAYGEELRKMINFNRLTQYDQNLS